MRYCTQCGTPVTSDSPEGLCARCLLSVAMRSQGAGGVDPMATQDSPAMPGFAASPAGAHIDIADAREIARRLPQFQILEMLGRGGMGVVYKARQVQLDRIVALKILPPADATSPGFVERFRREAQSLAKLSHPNIVHVYDFGETNGLYYFVMEFVDGANLRAMIHSQRMTPTEALAIVPKICDALQYAHDEGVVHRDIKPENILIDKRGRVKIADFGLAKLLGRAETDPRLTLSGAALGTPRYMAPEQVDKPESVDHRADIYSLGVVFYEMLTGELPMGRFDPPSHKVRIDVRLDEIVMHALERDVSRRYQHASQVRQDVEEVTSKPDIYPSSPAQPVAAHIPHPSGQVPFPGAPVINSKALWGAILDCGGFVLLLAGFLLSRVVDKQDPSILIVGGLLLFGAMLTLCGALCGGVAIAELKLAGNKGFDLQIAAAVVLVGPMAALFAGFYYYEPLPLIFEVLIFFGVANWAWKGIVGAPEKLTNSGGKMKLSNSSPPTPGMVLMPARSGQSGSLGTISLWCAIAGLLLPILFVIGASFLPERTPLPARIGLLCVFLGMMLEITALACGIVARRTAAGKAGLIIAIIALFLAVLAILFYSVMSVRNPIQTPAIQTPSPTERIERVPATQTKTEANP